MFLALDIIVVVIFFATLIGCIRRGFLLSVMSLLKSVVALVVSYLFAPALADFFKNSFLNEAITVPVRNRLDVMITETAGKFNLEKLFADQPQEFLDILERFGVKIGDYASSYGTNAQASTEQVSGLAEEITGSVVNTVSYILAFVTLFVVALIALTLVMTVLSAVVKLPIIRGADRALGTLFGLASGLLLALVLSVLAKVGFEALASAYPDTFEGVIEKTVVVKYLGNMEFGKYFVK